MSQDIGNSKSILANSNVQFGTSGVRGLVTDFSNEVCAAYSAAFIEVMKTNYVFNQIAIAVDNRPSSYAMAQACAQSALDCGVEVIYYGVIPTPALAFAAMQQNIPCIMITGSHIPFDRNGIKFYRPDGEITKQDEADILLVEAKVKPLGDLPTLNIDSSGAELYLERYSKLFQGTPLSGKRVGIYEHSSAGRDLYADVFQQLGAEVISLERSDTFVPIDTEAVSEEDCLKAKLWSESHNLDFIFSTDGDGDRPLVADESGNWLRGDILGLICANELNIDAIAIPVSCNTSIELSGYFKKVERTRIGSPYVIAAFEPLLTSFPTVAGFEANGGFILGSDIYFNQTLVKSLPTRDALLPAIVAIAAACDQNKTLEKIVASLPSRVTASDRIKGFATEKSLALIELGRKDTPKLLSDLGFADAALKEVDNTDGLRMTLLNGDIIHLRPSGNAPELRCYSESNEVTKAQDYVKQVLSRIGQM